MYEEGSPVALKEVTDVFMGLQDVEAMDAQDAEFNEDAEVSLTSPCLASRSHPTTGHDQDKPHHIQLLHCAVRVTVRQSCLPYLLLLTLQHARALVSSNCSMYGSPALFICRTLQRSSSRQAAVLCQMTTPRPDKLLQLHLRIRSRQMHSQQASRTSPQTLAAASKPLSARYRQYSTVEARASQDITFSAEVADTCPILDGTEAYLPTMTIDVCV